MKNYVIRFGSNAPSTYSGLSPTFILFTSVPGGTLQVAPSIAQIPTNTGLFTFPYQPATFPIAYILDGGGSLPASERYIAGILDPLQAVDERIGNTWDSIGSTNTDPVTVTGFLMRNQEVQEGTATFDKTTGIWSVLSRGTSAIALFSRTLTNLVGSVTKS